MTPSPTPKTFSAPASVIYTEESWDPPFPISKGVEVVVDLSFNFGTRTRINFGGVFEGRGGFAEEPLLASKTREKSNF